MDIELARTFLEILRTGSFMEAADRLHVTQTAVTARMQTLEGMLGSRLFTRNRAGAKLTAQGERFVDYANHLVHTWDSAKADLRLPLGHKSRVSIAGETSLWNPVLLNWIVWIKTHYPTIALQTEVGDSKSLLMKLEKGFLDAVIAHRPSYVSGLMVELLMEEKLIHVQHPEQPQPNFFIDWGPEFKAQYDQVVSRQVAYAFNLGPLALKILLKQGGNGYFRTRVVQPYLDSGALVRVEDAPEFTHPLYLVYRTQRDNHEFEGILSGLRRLAYDDPEWAL